MKCRVSETWAWLTQNGRLGQESSRSQSCVSEWSNVIPVSPNGTNASRLAAIILSFRVARQVWHYVSPCSRLKNSLLYVGFLLWRSSPFGMGYCALWSVLHVSPYLMFHGPNIMCCNPYAMFHGAYAIMPCSTAQMFVLMFDIACSTAAIQLSMVHTTCSGPYKLAFDPYNHMPSSMILDQRSIVLSSIFHVLYFYVACAMFHD